MTDLTTRPRLTDSAVDAVLAAARQAATALGGRMTIAVVDDGTTVRALTRLQQADLLTVDLALGKARLVAANGMPTREWRGIVAQDDFTGRTVPLALDRALGGAVLFGGGYPIVVDAMTIGGIGVSGGSETEDDDVARAGLGALRRADQFGDRQ